MNSWEKPLKIGVGLILLAGIWCCLWSFLFLLVTYGTPKGVMPWTAPHYLWVYGDYREIAEGLSLSALMATAGIVLPLAVLYFGGKNRKDLHGDARFAKPKEIRKAGLMADKGILVGKIQGKYLVYGGATSVCVGAPTRSGKGVGIVVPNLLNWPDSVVVLDMKQENYQLTAGYRTKHGQKCYLFDPLNPDGKTHRWNPLAYVSENPNRRVSDIQKIATLIWPDVSGEDPMWPSSARALFLGLALYVAESEDLPLTMGEIYAQATMGDDTRFADEIIKRAEEGRPLSKPCVAALSDYVNTNDKTRQSIRKTFTASLELWANPVVCAATSANDFDFRDLRKKRMSIYVGAQPGDMKTLGRILNLFFQQVVDINTQTLPEHDPALKYQCLLLHDEFAALGRMYSLAHAISYIGGYGLRMLNVYQSDGQLKAKELYGPELTDSFLENHGVRIYFPPKDNRVAKEISDTMGTHTVTVKSTTRQIPKLFGESSSSKSVTESDQSRELMKPQEIRELSNKRSIILAEGTRPILADKIRYYEDPDFTARLLEAPDVAPIDLDEYLNDQAHIPGGEWVARSMTQADLESLDTLKLDDFSQDFSDIDVPAGELDDNAVDDLVAQFMAKSA